MRQQAQEPPGMLPPYLIVVFLAVLLPFRHALGKRCDQRWMP